MSLSGLFYFTYHVLRPAFHGWPFFCAVASGSLSGIILTAEEFALSNAVECAFESVD